LNNGEISYPLQKEDSKDGFNLVGNPYLSYIDWDEANTPGKWQKLKMYNNIWLYNDRKANYPETYAAYNGVVGVNGGSNLIKAGQGFYIMSKGTGSLTATDAVRRSRTDLTNNASKPNNRVLYLEVKGSVYKDQIAIGFHDKALDLLDSLDCQKMMGSNPSIPNLYSIWGKTTDVITSKKKLAINFLSLDTLLKMDAYLEIPVGISIAEPANLSISASNLDVFDAKYYIFIRDNVYRNLTDLRNDDYQFTADGDADGRFTLLISDRDLTTATEQLPIGWSVYSSENKIYFASKNFTGGEYRVSLIDMAGRSIESRPYYNGSDYFELRTSGVYMIRITGPDILYSGKFFVKF
jgi:hypothetical protein